LRVWKLLNKEDLVVVGQSIKPEVAIIIVFTFPRFNGKRERGSIGKTVVLASVETVDVELIGKRVALVSGETIQERLPGQVNEDLIVKDCSSHP
jgi:hypothetical protein